VVTVTTVAMETMVATAACRARLNGVLSSCNGSSRSRTVIDAEDVNLDCYHGLKIL
jgi:hypothetical protein